MSNTYFLSFIEECIMNPDYNDYVGGRLEIYDNSRESPYAIEEVRFFTKDKEGFYNFREQWDFTDVTSTELANIISDLTTKYHIGYK